MSWRCVFGHDWDGCICARCGRNRDQQHDWETVQCQAKCRRCGRPGAQDHEWDKCHCRRCGAEKHSWTDGTCLVCGERCPHPEMHEDWDSRFFHRPGVVTRVCSRCGCKLDAPGKPTAFPPVGG